MVDTNVPAPQSPPGAPRWMKWALIASLAVNLVIVGGAVGHRFFGHPGSWRGDRIEQFGIMGYARKLDPSRRAIVRKAVQAERGNQTELRREVVRARIAVSEELTREPFDREKVEAALARFREAEAKFKTSGISTLLNAAEQMTADERRGLVDWWRHRRPHHFREPRAADGALPLTDGK